MKKFTAKVTKLYGDPQNPEPAQHIILFGGGSIEVSRTENEDYWVHIAVNKKESLQEDYFNCKLGNIIESRIDRAYPHNLEKGIQDIDSLDEVEHIAVRIKTS